MANVNVDDILDDMSLSDDEMLDSLADDMLMELEANSSSSDDDDDAIEEIHTSSRSTPAARPPHMAMPMGFPAAMGGGNNAGAAPDLGKMMSQMMPMMSQMFGGNGASPLFGGGAQANALRGPQQSWEDVVRQHVPVSEQAEWLATIKRDEQTLRAQSSASTPHSRAYRQHANPLPNVYMEVETLFASMLNEAVRAAHCEHGPKWRQYHDNLVSQLTRSGLTKVFEREFKTQLRARVANDPDFVAEKDAPRFRNIATALAV